MRGSDVKQMREDAKMSQADLAIATAIPQGRIAKWEIRNSALNVIDGNKVLKALGKEPILKPDSLSISTDVFNALAEAEKVRDFYNYVQQLDITNYCKIELKHVSNKIISELMQIP